MDLTDTLARSYRRPPQKGAPPQTGQDSLLKYYLKMPIEGASLPRYSTKEVVRLSSIELAFPLHY